MSVRLKAMTFDVRDPEPVARFWAALLDRDVVPEPLGLLVPGTDTQVGLRFAAAAAPSPDEPRFHLHLTSETPEHQQATIDRALALGGAHLDVGQGPDDGFVVLADPAGGALCVIEAGNSFLAGCGFLGEVTCDGSRDVGVFWSAALDWPLVWDSDGETAVQSPAGGTKVAWGGPPFAPRTGRNAQRFEVTASDPAADVDRLVTLGASVVGDLDGGVELTDPDGNELLVVAHQPAEPPATS